MEDARSQLQLVLEGLPAPPEAVIERDPATSVTGLVTLATCPQRYYWSEVDRLPRRPSPWLRRGTAVHRQIELHHRGVSPLDGIDATATSPFANAADYDQPVRGAFTTFTQSRFADAAPLLVETPIDFQVEGTRIRGRIDAIFEPEPGLWEIVDYKSGSAHDDPTRVVQLQAYAVAAAAGAVTGGTPEAMRVTFVYLGGDPAEEVGFDVTDEWLQEATERITQLAQAAAGEEFPPTPSAECGRCDFLSFCTTGAEWLAEHDEGS